MGFSRTTIGLVLSFFSIGALALVLQTLLLREFLVVFSGNEMGLGLVFSFWLLGITAGAWISGRLSNFFNNGLLPFIVTIIIFVFLTPILLYLVRFTRQFLDIPIGQYASFGKLIWATAMIAIPAALPVGFVFPIAGTVGKNLGLKTQSIGTLYTYEAAGATAAGIIYTYNLAGRIDAFNSVAPFLVFTLLGCTLLLFFLRHRIIFFLFAFLSLLFFLFFVFGFFSKLDRISIEGRWNRIAPGLELVENMDSMYQNLSVGRLVDQFSFYGNGEVFSTIPDPYSNQIKANLIACQHANPRKALVIGTGVEEMVPNFYRHGIYQVDILESDKMAQEMVNRFLSDDNKTQLLQEGVTQISEDARVFLPNVPKGRYDLIFMNLPDPSTAMINRFYTREFFEDAANALSPEGVLTLSVTSGSNYIGEQVGLYVGSVYNTLRVVFANVVALPGDTSIMFASNSRDSCSGDWKVLQDRYRERNLSIKNFSPAVFEMLMPPSRMISFREELNRYKQALINTDRRPVTYFYNLLLWDQFSGGQLQTALRSLNKTGYSTVLVVVLLLGSAAVLVTLLFRGRAERKSIQFGAAWLIFTTGLAGMGVEMIILFAFQNIHGALYERIGLFVAMYMLGLSLGGGLITRRIDRQNRSIFRYLLLTEIFLIVAPLLFAMTIGYRMPSIFFYFSILLVGFGAGMQFPAAAKIAAGSHTSVARTAALIDWSDHFGAFLGAALTGIFLIPIFGLPATCLIIAILKTSSLFSTFLLRSEVME